MKLYGFVFYQLIQDTSSIRCLYWSTTNVLILTAGINACVKPWDIIRRGLLSYPWVIPVKYSIPIFERIVADKESMSLLVMCACVLDTCTGLFIQGYMPMLYAKEIILHSYSRKYVYSISLGNCLLFIWLRIS